MSCSASRPARSSVDEGSRLTSHGKSTIYDKRAPHSVRTPTTGKTTHVPRQPVCADYTTGRGHTAVRQHCLGSHSNWTHLQSCYAMPPQFQVASSQLSSQVNVSIGLYGLRPDRRCSPGGVATVVTVATGSLQQDKHPSLSPVSTKLLVTHCVSAVEFG